MSEFVQHHKNVGFVQMVIGFIADDLRSSEMIRIQQRLASYIEEGTVVFTAATAPGMECGTEQLKVTFYQWCLYHSKGTSEYVEIWDLDVLWVPSPSFQLLPPDTETSSADRSTAISPLLLHDPLWKGSQYTERYSVTLSNECFEGLPTVLWVLCYRLVLSLLSFVRCTSKAKKTQTNEAHPVNYARFWTTRR
jgi:hypothetical protein